MFQKKGQTEKELHRSVNYHFNLGPMTTLTIPLYVSLYCLYLYHAILFTVHLANKACPQHAECQATELLQVSLEWCSATGKLEMLPILPHRSRKKKLIAYAAILIT